MNYQQTIQYLYSRLPMFSRQGKTAIKPGLENIIRLCGMLENPHTKFKSIHIGGTNGKGSTSHMLAAILQTAGYKTGLYTSPHLRDFRERIRINGEMISELGVVNFVEDHQTLIEEIQPSFFEATLAMAFDHFARAQVDIAIIEVGLGGRLDSTNIITPILSVITNIGYDHTDLLGNTLSAIAAEKAGIIKNNVPVIIGEKQPEVESVFVRKAAEMGSDIKFASANWAIKSLQLGNSSTEGHPGKGIENNRDHLCLEAGPQNNGQFTTNTIRLCLDLTGSYQKKNLATVLSVVSALQKMGFSIAPEHLKTALKNVQSITGLAGRWQTLGMRPLIICDTGHNEDGIREVLKNIKATTFARLHIVLGMVKDKDISKILPMLPKDAAYYFCQPAIARAKPAVELAVQARDFGLNGNYFATVVAALNAAKEQALPEDFIFVGGSTFVVAEVV